MHTVNRLNHFQSGQVSGIEVILDNYAVLENDTWEIGSFLEKCIDRYGAKYTARNVEQLNPAIFAWLGVLDVDIWVILVLMMGVAGFTMISGLLILIIERAAMIGTLKSLGANNGIIRRVFLWLSVFIIGRGMLWGNVIGLGFCLLQYYTGLLTLDAETYYMDAVPIAFNIKYLILLNALLYRSNMHETVGGLLFRIRLYSVAGLYGNGRWMYNRFFLLNRQCSFHRRDCMG